jgi:Sec-independent protein secretion pathway component TatC
MYKFVNPISILGKKEGRYLWMLAILSSLAFMGGILFGFVWQNSSMCGIFFITSFILQGVGIPLLLKAQHLFSQGGDYE